MIITSTVTRCMRIEIMLATVDFDNKTMPEADEIHDEAITRRLSAKVKAPLSP